jgi:hypothetical protein
MNQKDCMFYVAEDPAQPGSAFAACADEPKYAEHTAADLADWESRGAIIRRVDGETMRQMMLKWKRQGQQRLL